MRGDSDCCCCAHKGTIFREILSPEGVRDLAQSYPRTWTSRMRPRTNKSGREGQAKEPHVSRGDSGKDPPPVKQKPRSQWIDVRDRSEGDPTGSPGKGLFVVVVVVVAAAAAVGGVVVVVAAAAAAAGTTAKSIARTSSLEAGMSLLKSY